MRQRLFIALCLLAFLPLPAFSIAGTEGREFWVALTIGRGPKDASSGFEPKLYVSSKTRTGVVTVTNPQTGFSKSYPIPTGTGWLEISDIPTTEWYPFAASVTGQQKASGNTYKTGLKVTCSEDMSVFAALRYTNAFDASNILPITALQTDYIVQDYPPYANETPTTSFSNFCVLATENNTKVEITPAKKTYDGKAAGSTFTVTLNAGDVYYVVSEQSSDDDKDSQNAPEKSLSGSYIKSDKPVAVFNGDICTRIPNSKSARDIAYEQAIPIDYWGREFIVTRSAEKDANRIRITAQEDDTQIKIDGNVLTTLSARETYEIELAGGAMKDYDKQLIKPDARFEGDVLYIQTSCPCAVYNYDTGNSYTRSSDSEFYSEYGDPSMSWMSPLDQNINEITFGVMNTDKTTRHFVNIVTLTENVSSMELHEVVAGQYSNNMLSAADFQPVPAYPAYSYARKSLSIDKNTTYNLKGTKGFVAHVYGNGDDESYAYSVGSAAVKQGVRVGDYTLVEGVADDVDFCVGDELSFDAQVTSAYIVDEVDWDFGDGVTELNSMNIQTTHTYDSPGWYDLKVKVRAHKECPLGTYPDIDIQVAVHIVQPDTVYMPGTHDCIDESEAEAGVNYPIIVIDTITEGCSLVKITPTAVGLITHYTIPEQIIGYDSCLWMGKWYYESGEYTDTMAGGNSMQCDSIITCNIKIVGCLNMSITLEKDSFCADEEELNIFYNITKGNFVANTARLILSDGREIALTVDESGQRMYVPLSELTPGIYNCQLAVYDEFCEREWAAPLHFVVQYASSVFRQKWDDVLVVPNSTIEDYDIIGYQWLKNGEEIAGATGAWYYCPDYGVETVLDPDAEYSIRLTNRNNEILESCAITPQSVSNKQAISARIAPTRLMPQEEISIETDGEATVEIFNTLGVRENMKSFTDATNITAPRENGIYIIQVTISDGGKVSKQLVVSR